MFAPDYASGEIAEIAQKLRRRAGFGGDAARRAALSTRAPGAVSIVAMLSKVAVVGVGAVGQACAFALMLRGSAHEIVLVDRSAERAAGVATDMRYGLPLSPTVGMTSGGWSDLAAAGVVLICAGVNEKRRRNGPRGRARAAEAARDERRDLPRHRPAHRRGSA